MKILKMTAYKTCSAGLLWLLLLASSMSHAVTYFEQCDSALKKPSFHLLAQYLDAHSGLLDQDDGDSMPDICFQLNSHEYFVIADFVHTGGGNSNDGMFLCNFKEQMQCLRSGEEGAQPDVIKEFSDGKGKHFVLFDAVGVSSGEATKGYEVFYLTTPSEATDGLPYVMQGLFYSDKWRKFGLDHQSDSVSQLCKFDDDVHELIDVNTYTDFTDDQYIIGLDEAGDADIKFTHAEKDCHTEKLSWHSREFLFKHGKFQKVKVGSVKIKKQVTMSTAS